MANTLSARFYGFERPYEEYTALMRTIHAKIAAGLCTDDQLMLLEHKPVITFTRQHQHQSLITSPEVIQACGIDLCEADRGGDATFHGPGQLVGYPLINLKNKALDITSYIRGLEKALLTALLSLGLKRPQTIAGFTGIWLRHDEQKISLKKLCAIGVGVKDGVTKHGFALNISINTEPFVKHIIPCGLRDRGTVTLKEAFSHERLEMPDYLVILEAISKSIAQTFSLELCCKGLNHG